jgi:hypothetical protein
MTTLSPVGRGRSGGAWQVVVAVVVALAVGIGGGILYTNHSKGAAAAPSSTCTPTAKASKSAAPVKYPAPSTITVNVYNATNRKGLAKSTSGDLVARGFIAGKIANDPLKKSVPGSAEIRYGPAGTLGAHVVAAQVVGGKLVRDARKDATVDFVVGDGFTALASPEQVKAVLSPSASPSASASC